eukprot:TRINITY_DN1510_c0_g1_i1.p1 TRINITY_DN1510_c0_g1~~TRINITY_DN1510_c0_g1_i1.p1  ORF type:complete len:344 (+),score=101.53 TRINITY_DN1510_c0_g1_i1:756-1787(+)
MSGAEYVDDTILDGRVLINLDSEEENRICLGCAGGYEVKIKFDGSRASVDTASGTFYHIRVFNLMGGHSGVDINKNRGNAIKILGKMLESVSDIILIQSITGGTAINTIPREVSAVVFVENENITRFTDNVSDVFQQENEMHAVVETNLNFTSKVTEVGNTTVYDSELSKNLIIALNMSPSGVLSYSDVLPDEVESSICLSIIGEENNTPYIHFFPRFNTDEQGELTLNQLVDITSAINGATISEKFNAFPGWNPDTSTMILKSLKRSFEKETYYDEPATEYSIHAGLECGLLIGRYPDMQAVSIGPTIENAHTPDEALYVDSVLPFYNVLKETLRDFAEENK